MELTKYCFVSAALLLYVLPTPLLSSPPSTLDTTDTLINLNVTNLDNVTTSLADFFPGSFGDPVLPSTRPNARPRLRQNADDPAIAPGPLFYALLSVVSGLWKLEDNQPFQRPVPFRAKEFRPLHVIVTFTPIHSNSHISLTPSAAIWMLYDVLKYVLNHHRWNAATFDLTDDATGYTFGLLEIASQFIPPSLSANVTLPKARNATAALTRPTTGDDENTLSALERLLVHTDIDSSQSFTRDQIFEMFIVATFWIYGNRASEIVERSAHVGHGMRIGVVGVEIVLVLANLGNRREGFLRWEQIGDAWRALMVQAIRSAEHAGVGNPMYHSMEASFLRPRDRKIMLRTKFYQQR